MLWHIHVSSAIICIVMLLPLRKSQLQCYNGICGPKNWPGLCKNGTTQSPVNIVLSKLVKSRPGAGKRKTKILKFSKGFYEVQQFEMGNTGHTAGMILFPGTAKDPIQVEGAGFTGTYTFDALSFAWPSEHAINGKRYPLEMNMVFMSPAGAFGVLSIIYGNLTSKSKALQPIINMLPQVTNAGQGVAGIYVKLSDFLPNVWDVFRYNGSQMGPPCTEGYLRSVFTQRMPISNTQVAQFKKLKDSTGVMMKSINRPLQPLVTKNRKHVIWMQVDKNQMTANPF